VSRNRFDKRPMRPRILLAATLILTTLLASQALSASHALAASPAVRDAGTLQLPDVIYRLDGIDAPAFDQICIDEHADAWTCGVEARDQLAKLIDNREVRCEDLGADPAYKKRHLGICTVEGETVSLNQLLVREGFALHLDPWQRGASRRTKPARKTIAVGSGRAALSRRRNSATGKRTARCWALRADPTRTAKFAECCFLMIPPCRRVAASRASSRCVRG
jgi:endonuclease YncB( thermonuclease family)